MQTNEVGRLAALLPAFSLLAGREPGRALGLVELGASAGLLLFPDRVRCRYALAGGSAVERGAAGSPLLLPCESRGEGAGDLPAAEVRVASRIGIDRAPVDLRDDDAVLWLRALVWPGRPERETRLSLAAALARAEPPDLRRGDAADLLPGALAAVPAESLPVVFHTAAWVLFSEETRRGVERTLAAASAVRPLARASLESVSGRAGDLVVEEWRDGRPRPLHRGRAHLHGAWLQWSPGAPGL